MARFTFISRWLTQLQRRLRFIPRGLEQLQSKLRGVPAWVARQERRTLIIMAAAVVLVCGGSLTAWLLLRGPAIPADPAGMNHQQLVAAVSSPAFRNQDSEVRRAYMSALYTQGRAEGVNPGNMSEEQRRQMFENMRGAGEEMIRERIDAFFALPPEERTAHLDRMIDGFGAMMGGRMGGGVGGPGGQPRPEGRGGAPGGGRRGMTPDRLRGMIDRTSAQDRARFAEFMEAMRDRMRERGIEPGRR